MNIPRNYLRLAAVVIPLVVIASWMVFHAIGRETGDEFELPIRGYDPRDLLSGHYLQYQVDYGRAIQCQAGRTWCVCLREVKGVTSAAWDGECSTASQFAKSESCRMMKGVCTGSRFEAGIERFYFPEEFTRQLVTVPTGATIKISLGKSGRAVVKDLFVNGKPVLEYLRSQPQ